MAFITLNKTDEFDVYQRDEIKRSVSLVISLIDDFTKKEPIRPLNVLLEDGKIKPVKNLSGFYVFLNLKNSKNIVKIISEFYFPEDKTIVIPEFDGKGPASGATNVKLKDVSDLQKGDIIAFHNINGNVEKKEITSINAKTKKISWTEELRYNFNAPDDEILALKYLDTVISLKPLPSYPFHNQATLIRGLLEDSHGNPIVGATVKITKLNIETKSYKKGEFVLYFNDIKNERISIDIEKDRKNMKPANIDLKDITLEEGVTRSLGKIYFYED